MERAAETPRRYLIGQAEFTARQIEPALYLVATPIGNLADITLRALETLAAADVIACEDTRVTRILLERYGMRRRLTAYHEHNAAEAGSRLLAALTEGKSVALVSDAGTPLISDPGYRLVGQAAAAGCRVVPIPGASAVLAALTASGLPSDTFLFTGFLPVKAGQRQARLNQLAAVPTTLVVFESPRRVAATLAAMAGILGGLRRAAVGRELTKLYEEISAAPLAGLAATFAAGPSPKGEIVIVVEPPPAAPETSAADVDALLLELAEGRPAAKAAAEAARKTGIAKSDLYRRLLKLNPARRA